MRITAQSNKWGLFLGVSLCVHFAVLLLVPPISVPPPLTKQWGMVTLVEFLFVVPLLWSVFAVWQSRGRADKLVAFVSLATSFIWIFFGIQLLMAVWS
jgi:hypothetical protein